MDNKHALTWFARGFALTVLVLLVVVMTAWTAFGQSQSSDEPGSNWAAQVPGDGSPQVAEPHWVGDTVATSYTSPLVIPAAAFTSDGGDPDGFFFSFNDGYINGSGTACLKAPAYLPNGATITSVYAFLYDNASGNVTVNLRRVNVDTGTSNVMAEPGTVADSTAIQQRSDTTIAYPEISYPDYAYFVTTCLNYADHRLYSVHINYKGP
jgi:hypothetical protein